MPLSFQKSTNNRSGSVEVGFYGKPAVLSLSEREKSQLIAPFGINRMGSEISGVKLKGPARIAVVSPILENQITKLGIDTLKADLETPITVDLATPPFSAGKLTIKPIDGIKGSQGQIQYETVIDFENDLPKLRYWTNHLTNENIHNIVNNSAILASLDKKILMKTKEKGSMLIISTDSRFLSKKSNPLQHGIFLQLAWNEAEQTVEALEIRPNSPVLMEDVRQQAIDNNTQIYFIVDKLKQNRGLSPSTGGNLNQSIERFVE